MPRRLPQIEFTILLALMFATVAFSIDAMLPGLPDIAADLTPDDVNRAQLVLTSFVFGMGFGTLVSGPVSDHWGRKPIILFGLGLYITGALIAGFSGSLEVMLAGRVLQGMGAAFPRTVGVAMVRDLYEGREMAKITSFVMTIFMVAPAAAPSIGAFIIAGFGWHGIFASFVLLALIVGTWLGLRQDETLLPENRRHLNWTDLAGGVREVFGNYNVRIYIAILTLGFAQMFAILSSVQQIYETTYGMADTFPYWFGATALVSAAGAILNGNLVSRLGMHFMIRLGYSISLTASTIALVLNLAGFTDSFAIFFLWTVAMFSIAALTFGNLNALALSPLGRLAGLANSLIGATFTMGSVLIAAPVGLMFNGTAIPVVTAGMICSGLALFLFRLERR
ncbi:multidrug effflux MFS transporter [Celeribacter indicus]|uniref:Major facilitator superfamily protein n=1 Tax=Celeribacter indicus TaxID=1208324 RepID=A0A0B5E2K5_9RHOB|nr:multidrug effflux MFS transporter [Celeribacter indicus]AJE47256.1 major facilitator superfamily protein [Celeribacter indicus]SDW01776.1 MFS transporter, DHA1 family, bicyclomycin/chloramphenicol resistance protein [Celeribacter indicus]